MGNDYFSAKYYLLLKTGDAELRAMENFMEDRSNLIPIIEITRGRKSKLDKQGDIEKRLAKIKDIFAGQDVVLDLTTVKDLSNKKINELYDPADGYKNWLDFLIELKKEKVFGDITPTILLDTSDENYEKNLSNQVKSLSYNFKKLCYRNNLKDEGFVDDIECIKNFINKRKIDLIFVFDCEYISAASWSSYATRIKGRLNTVSSLIPDAKFVISSTSFPKYVSDIGDEKTDTFQIYEIDLFNDVKSTFKQKEVFYSDYGSINPERNDGVTMSRGWRPRIDVALERMIFYYRQKREDKEYSNVYTDIALNYVLPNKLFPHKLRSNWGVQQIISCANGLKPGSSPSFWISVRMNMHIEQQLRRLKLL